MVRYGTIRKLAQRGKQTTNYFVRIYREGGRDTWLTTGCRTRQEALAWVRERELEQLQERGEPQRQPEKPRLFSEAFAAWVLSKQGMVSEKHLYDIRSRGERFWLPHFGGRALGSITSTDVRAFLQLRKSGSVPGAMTGRSLAVFTVNNDLTWLKALFSFAIDEGWIDRSPARAIKPLSGAMKRRIRTLTAEEEARILEACRTDAVVEVTARRHTGGSRGGLPTKESTFKQRVSVPEYLYYLVLTALYCGFRRRTLLSLRWRDIDSGSRRWSIPGEFMKTATDYEAPIPAIVLAALLQYRDLLRDRPNAVARLRQDSTIFGLSPSSGVTKSFQRAVRRAALGGFTFHDCRRVYLNRLRDSGVSIETAMALTGHRSIQTVLKHYRQVPEADLVEAVRRIDRTPGKDAVGM